MPRNGSYTLGEVTAERVVVECEICNRRGTYSTAGLVEKYGADVTMPDLKFKLVNCQNIDTSNLNPCSEGVYVSGADGKWSILESPPSGSSEVFVEVDYFGSVKISQKPSP